MCELFLFCFVEFMFGLRFDVECFGSDGDDGCDEDNDDNFGDIDQDFFGKFLYFTNIAYFLVKKEKNFLSVMPNFLEGPSNSSVSHGVSL